MRLVQEPAAPLVSDKNNKNDGSALTLPALFRTNGLFFWSNCRSGPPNGCGRLPVPVVSPGPVPAGAGRQSPDTGWLPTFQPMIGEREAVLQSVVHADSPQNAPGGMGAWTPSPNRLVVHARRPWNALQRDPAWTTDCKSCPLPESQRKNCNKRFSSYICSPDRNLRRVELERWVSG